MMSKNYHVDKQAYQELVAETMFPTDGRRGVEDFHGKSVDRPRLRVRTIERTALIRFEDAEILFEGSVVQAVSEQLHRLIEEGHTRLLVNFAGVRYLSSEVLGILAGLHEKSNLTRRRIALCNLDPLLRDMVRITHLDRLFDVYDDEAEALGGHSADGVDGVGT